MIQPGALDDWSVKDVIAHVTWWEEALTHLTLILEDERLPRYADQYVGIDACNAKTPDMPGSIPGPGPPGAGRNPPLTGGLFEGCARGINCS